MHARYLDSRDVETLSEAMLKAASRSREMDVAAAFLTKAGVEQVLHLAHRLTGPQKRRQIRVLVGTWLSVTEPKALQQLRQAKGVRLRIAKVPGFHVKHISFRGANNVVAFTGSANFTEKGLGGKGELVVELTDAVRSSTASVERDAFRRLWDDAYQDDLTDEVIAEYTRNWRKPSFLAEAGVRSGKNLLRRFGRRRTKSFGQDDDGSVLWFPVNGTLSPTTAEVLRVEAAKVNSSDFVGLGSKATFARILKGTRQVWVLDRRGGLRDRSLDFQRVIRVVEMPTERDGRYFAILSPVTRSVSMKRANRVALKELKLVHRIDSLASETRTLRAGVAAKLMELSALTKRKRR